MSILAGLAVTLVAGSSSSFGQSADSLIDKLVEKGILSVKEANELREETDRNFTTAYQARSGMPDWVSALKFNGDMRARYDGIYSSMPGVFDRHRVRYRLRFGAVASLFDNFEVGLRLASSTSTGGDGGGDPISTNETLGNNGNRKPIGIDLVYAKWSPLNTPAWSGSFTFGKMENPYSFSEMIFDGDYTPEGFGQQLSYRFNDAHVVRLSAGQFFLDELSSSSRDPFMLGAQGRVDSTWSTHWQTTFSAAGLSIISPESLVSSGVPDVNAGNTRTPGGVLVNGYDLVIVDAGLIYNLESFPFYSGVFPIKLAAEYIHNFGASSKNVAYGFGPTFGKAGRKGTWEVSVKYKELPADAVYEETVDSDYGAFYRSAPPYDATRGYRAGVNTRGPVFRVSYSIFDSLTFSAMYAITELIDEVPLGSRSDGSRLIVDAVWKF